MIRSLFTGKSIFALLEDRAPDAREFSEPHAYYGLGGVDFTLSRKAPTDGGVIADVRLKKGEIDNFTDFMRAVALEADAAHLDSDAGEEFDQDFNLMAAEAEAAPHHAGFGGLTPELASSFLDDFDEAA